MRRSLLSTKVFNQEHIWVHFQCRPTSIVGFRSKLPWLLVWDTWPPPSNLQLEITQEQRFLPPSTPSLQVIFQQINWHSKPWIRTSGLSTPMCPTVDKFSVQAGAVKLTVVPCSVPQWAHRHQAPKVIGHTHAACTTACREQGAQQRFTVHRCIFGFHEAICGTWPGTRPGLPAQHY